MKNYDKNVISLCLIYLDVRNLQGWGMSQKLPVNGFKWIKNAFKVHEDFINYNKNSSRGYILEVHVEYSKNRMKK